MSEELRESIAQLIASFNIAVNDIENSTLERDAKMFQLEEERENEHDRSVYYQNIVYGVCDVFDRMIDGNVVCGTKDAPTTEVVDMANALMVRIKDAERHRTTNAVVAERERLEGMIAERDATITNGRVFVKKLIKEISDLKEQSDESEPDECEHNHCVTYLVEALGGHTFDIRACTSCNEILKAWRQR